MLAQHLQPPALPTRAMRVHARRQTHMHMRANQKRDYSFMVEEKCRKGLF